ncbi:BnaA09g27610D [Brassica napus]|uniref:BnaA09g27610D protein n=1 Tax=Brassica napus TaxID=3708 RepID=A0A078GQK8_BRANA|nr:BnaA09g27610D [Brassica napus]
MSSNGKLTLSGDLNSKKQRGVGADSFPGGSSGISIGDPHSKKSKGDASVSSPGLNKPIGATGPIVERAKSVVSSGVRGKAAVSSDVRGKAIVSVNVREVMFFKDVNFGPHEGEVRFRLIHFWEARNVLTKLLFGLEMLLIDEEGTVIQGFIPSARIETYLPHMKAGGIYRLNNFFGSRNKTLYRVAEPSVVITFSSTSALSVLENSPVCFPDDRFRFHGYEEFDAACDLKGDLYDYVGHIKLVNGQVLNDSLVLDESEIASTRRILLHVQTHEGPVIKLYLWDKAAFDFSEKFKASGGTAKVILVTTLNPKRFGGALSLSSMASSRVFMDSDVQATRDYLAWLVSNSDVANRVDADVVTKTETVTIGELFSYMKQVAAKVAWFECIATVADVVHGLSWYYIGCGVCHTKATKGPTTLMCKKCGKSDIVGVPQFLAKISVYDKSDQAFFFLLGDAGHELTGKKASELVESYFEANESVRDDHIVPVPQALSDTIGQTRKFIVKVSNHNLTGKTQSLTVTKVLHSDDPELEGELEEDVIIPAAQKTLDDGGAEDDPSMDSKGEKVKRAAQNDEAGDPKRAKCG